MWVHATMSGMADDIVWEEPPVTALRSGEKSGHFREFAVTLRKNREKWAVLPGERKTTESAKGTALNIRNGKMAGFGPKGAFETATDGVKIYVRFVGEDGIEEPSSEGATPRRSTETSDEGKHVPSKVREWALANNYELSERGRMPQHVLDAYYAAHGDSPANPSLAVHSDD